MQPGRSRSPWLPVSACAKVVRRIDNREAALYYAQDDKIKARGDLTGPAPRFRTTTKEVLALAIVAS